MSIAGISSISHLPFNHLPFTISHLPFNHLPFTICFPPFKPFPLGEGLGEGWGEALHLPFNHLPFTFGSSLRSGAGGKRNVLGAN
jgi:hypothetical protein